MSSRVCVDRAIAEAVALDVAGGRTIASGLRTVRMLLNAITDAPDSTARAELTGAAKAQTEAVIVRAGGCL